MLFCPHGNLQDGVVELCPTTNSPALYFTEIVVDGNLTIPPQKPPKDRIVNVSHKIELKDVQVIEVTLPGATAPAGSKIFVAGTITLGIQYIAVGPEQKVHYVHYELPFEALILNDCEGLITDLPENYVIHVCVEKIRVSQVDPRTLNKEIVLMIWVEEVTI